MNIKRLREWARYRETFSTHYEGCEEGHFGCAMLALIERLEEAEAQRDALQDRLTCMCGDDIDHHPYGDSHSPVSMHNYYRAEFDEVEQKLVTVEAQRDRLILALQEISEMNSPALCIETAKGALELEGIAYE